MASSHSSKASVRTASYFCPVLSQETPANSSSKQKQSSFLIFDVVACIISNKHYRSAPCPLPLSNCLLSGTMYIVVFLPSPIKNKPKNVEQPTAAAAAPTCGKFICMEFEASISFSRNNATIVFNKTGRSSIHVGRHY